MAILSFKVQYIDLKSEFANNLKLKNNYVFQANLLGTEKEES